MLSHVIVIGRSKAGESITGVVSIVEIIVVIRQGSFREYSHYRFFLLGQ
jgi:hypothetical protein